MVVVCLNQWPFSIIFRKPLSPYKASLSFLRASQVALVLENLPANAGNIRDAGSIPRLGRSPGGRHGIPLQYSCLENSMNRGTWQATVHGVAQSQTRLKRLITHVIIKMHPSVSQLLYHCGLFFCSPFIFGVFPCLLLFTL